MFLLLLLGAVTLTAPLWWRLLRQPLASHEVEDEARPAVVPAAGEKDAAEIERRIKVKLYFVAGDGRTLQAEEREIVASADLARQVRGVIEELVRGPKGGLAPALSPATRVLEVFVSPRGTAYVDLSKDVAEGANGSVGELLTVYSLVNSLTLNLPAVRRVQILVEDKPAATLAGHIDLSGALGPERSLVSGTAP